MNIKVLPLLLKHRVDKSGKSQIVLRVYLNSKVICNDKLGKKVESKFWDPETRQVMKSPNHDLINALIKKRVAELEHEFLQKELSNVKLTRDKIKTIVKGADYSKDFLAYCKERIPERYPKPAQKETRRTYMGEITKLQKFQQDVSFGDLSPHFLSRYKGWLINNEGNSDNTVWKAFKFINTMIIDAIPAGYIKENPFKEFDRGKYVQGKRNFLDLTDCDKIHEVMKGSIPDRLRLVAAYYLFMCYTGFRFRDATLFFNYDEHVVNDECIIIKTEKFGVDVQIWIHDRLRRILDLIRSHHLQISNSEFNDYARILATMAKIDVPFTAHTGRHTFGANLALLDVPIKRAQQLLGHKNSRSTEVYYHITDKSLHEEMRKWDK